MGNLAKRLLVSFSVFQRLLASFSVFQRFLASFCVFSRLIASFSVFQRLFASIWVFLRLLASFSVFQRLSKFSYPIMMIKLKSWAIPTPATNPAVVLQPNMIETKTKDQMRNPTVKAIQSSTRLFISFLAAMTSKRLMRAYLKKRTMFENLRKVSFNKSLASYFYILSGQKFIKNANVGEFLKS